MFVPQALAAALAVAPAQSTTTPPAENPPVVQRVGLMGELVNKWPFDSHCEDREDPKAVARRIQNDLNEKFGVAGAWTVKPDHIYHWKCVSTPYGKFSSTYKAQQTSTDPVTGQRVDTVVNNGPAGFVFERLYGEGEKRVPGEPSEGEKPFTIEDKSNVAILKELSEQRLTAKERAGSPAAPVLGLDNEKLKLIAGEFGRYTGKLWNYGPSAPLGERTEVCFTHFPPSPVGERALICHDSQGKWSVREPRYAEGLFLSAGGGFYEYQGVARKTKEETLNKHERGQVDQAKRIRETMLGAMNPKALQP